MLLVALTGLIAATAAFGLYLRLERVGRQGVPLALLRAVAWGAVGALLVNPGCRGGLATHPTVLLDASLSMSDTGDDSRWRAARDSARVAAGGGGLILVFGEQPGPLEEGTRPSASASKLLPALREAASRGGPVVIVTDGEVEDAPVLPRDLLVAARIVLLPRRVERDAGVAALDLPPSLRAGDTASADVELAAVGVMPSDTAAVELLESGRVVARSRFPLGSGGLVRREVRFIPAPAASEHETRVYEARLAGLPGDAEPRDDARRTAASVSRASAVVLVSDSPDWDFRWLAQALGSTAGVPVRAFVGLGRGQWREGRTMRPVGEAAVQAEVARATLLVAHGGEGALGVAGLARGALWRWPAGGAATGDWYVTSPEFASPAGSALAGVPPESLPPLEGVSDLRENSVEWTALTAQLERRGRSRPVVQGTSSDGRRVVRMGASGFWRWASKGGVAGEAYRALVASLAGWLLEERSVARTDLSALRDSLAREGRELLPRPRSLAAQEGNPMAEAGQPVPLRHTPWLYLASLLALVAEWIARRRRGLR